MMNMVMIMKIKLYIFVSIRILRLFFLPNQNSIVTFQGHVVKLAQLFVTNLYTLFAEIHC